MGWCRQLWAVLRQHRRLAMAVALVAAVAVALRLGYWLQYVALPAGQVAVGADVSEYDRWAREILSGQVLWTELPIHAPLYPFCLAALYALTGVSLPLVRLLQLGLDLVSLALVALALWRLVNARTALIGAGLWALYQPLIYYSAELLSEGLAVLWVSAALLCWAAAHRPGGRPPLRAWPLAVSALFCGLAAVTHPLTLALALPYLLWCFWRLQRQGPPATTQRATLALLLAGPFLLPILPVTLRNAAVSGEFVPIQAHAGLNLYIGNNPEATGTCYVRPGKDYEALVQRPLRAGITSESGARRFFRREVVRFVLSDPLRAGGLWLRKALLTWNATDLPSGPDLPIVQAQTAFMRIPLLRFGFVAPLALAAWAVTRRRPHLVPFLWAPVVGTLALALLVTSGRYRLMLTPALLAGAALACEGLWRAWRRDDQRAWMRAVALALLGLGVGHAVPVPPLPQAETEAVTLLAEAAWRAGDLRQAEHLARYALTSEPLDAALHHLLGNVHQEQGRAAEAAAEFREALRLDPGRSAAAVDLAICLASAGADAEAMALLRDAAAAAAVSADVWYNLGVLLEKAGDLQAAVDAYERALARDRTHASARLNLGMACLRRGELERGAAELALVVRLRPRDDKALGGLAVYHAQRRDYAAGAQYFTRAIAANPRREDLRAAYQAMRGEAARQAGAGAEPAP